MKYFSMNVRVCEEFLKNEFRGKSRKIDRERELLEGKQTTLFFFVSRRYLHPRIKTRNFGRHLSRQYMYNYPQQISGKLDHQQGPPQPQGP